MERKLASIRKVREIKPIEGADAIELAIVDDETYVLDSSGVWWLYSRGCLPRLGTPKSATPGDPQIVLCILISIILGWRLYVP